jgi:pimeloyl-ACP methyl ester carboxylesterase
MAVEEQEGVRRRPKATEGRYLLPDRSTARYIRAVPEGVPHRTPVILAPGFGETSRTFIEPAEELAVLGHDTFAISHTTELNDKDLQPLYERALTEVRARYAHLAPRRLNALLKGVRLPEFRKALALKSFIEAEVRRAGYAGRVNVVGHSQGGAYALVAAFLWPHLFDRLVLLNPAGQNGPVSYDTLFWRFHRSLSERLAKNPDKMAAPALRTVWYMLQRSLYWGRAKAEGQSLASFNAYPYLLALKDVGLHIRRVTVIDHTDSIFRHQEVKAAEAREGAGLGVSPFGERISVNSKGHYGLVEEPVEFAKLFDRLFA